MANIFYIERADNKVTIGTTDTTIYIGSHTASLLLSLDASKNLESVTDLTAWVAGTANQITVTDDTDGTITLSIPDPLAIPGKLTAGSFASPIDVTNTREYGFEIHYSGNNYNATAIRARTHAVTTDTSAQFQGGLFQAANSDNINVGVLNGLVAEAIGKATTNAATITMMRGALVGAEWSAKDTVTDLRTLHVRVHTRDAATEGYISGTGYGIYIENEAVDGNGQVLDAGIYFKGTNLSAGNKAYTYGLDFSGATYGTTEIKLKDGGTIGSSGASLNIDSSGNVGIGISPLSSAKAHIWNVDGGTSLQIDCRGTEITDSVDIDLLTLGNGTERLGVSAGAKGWKIKVAGNAYGTVAFRNNFELDFWNGTSWLAGGQGIMLIRSDTGNMGLGTLSPDTKLQVVGDCKFGDDNTNYVSFAADGSQSFSGTARIDWTKITANGVAIRNSHGTTSDNVNDLQTAHDGNVYTLSEESGETPGMDIEVDFTGVTAFNWVQILARYEQATAGHGITIMLEVSPFNGTAWHRYDFMQDQGADLTNEEHSFFVPDDAAYINSGVVKVRFVHEMIGTSANHDLVIDVCALYQ